MTEEEYNLELQARQSEHQQRVEQHLQTIEKSLKSMNINITMFGVVMIILIFILIAAAS